MIANETCVHQLFKVQAAKTPDALAVVAGDERKSYSELDQATDSLGAYLRHHGVSPDDRVGVFMETCSDYVVTCIGALKAGGAFMPLALDSPDNLLRNILAEAKPKVVIAKEQYFSRLSEYAGTHILAIDGEQSWRDYKAESDGPAVDSGNLAFVPYTSGTTGDPKGSNADPRFRNVIVFCQV